MASSPSRKKMKYAMLAIFLERDPKKKKLRSRKFTELLFSFAESLLKDASSEERASFRMESVGLFTTYILRKQKEKAESGGRASARLFREIAEESDELFDEIEARASRRSAAPPGSGRDSAYF